MSRVNAVVGIGIITATSGDVVDATLVVVTAVIVDIVVIVASDVYADTIASAAMISTLVFSFARPQNWPSA